MAGTGFLSESVPLNINTTTMVTIYSFAFVDEYQLRITSVIVQDLLSNNYLAFWTGQRSPFKFCLLLPFSTYSMVTILWWEED